MSRKRNILTIIYLVFISACLCLGVRLFRYNFKENELANGLNQDEIFNKDVIVMENKNKLTQKDSSQKNTSLKEKVNSEVSLINLIHKMDNKAELQNNLYGYPAETIIDTSGVSALQLDVLFYSSDISGDIKKRILGKSYSENCKIPYSDLRYIRLLYMGFDMKTHIGEMIVNKAIKDDTLDIFKDLYFAGYPIEKMVLVDEYDADDIASMAADNSSAFNYRFIDSTTKLSIHSYGLAIDINPRYNPYVRKISGKTVVLPANGLEYVDRNEECEYYIKSKDICYQAFTKRGFTWGGDWKNQKDYQHFQKDIN